MVDIVLLLVVAAVLAVAYCIMKVTELPSMEIAPVTSPHDLDCPVCRVGAQAYRQNRRGDWLVWHCWNCGARWKSRIAYLGVKEASDGR